ncbi:MAG: FecR domain-containing protein [Pseudomonas sp.]
MTEAQVTAAPAADALEEAAHWLMCLSDSDVTAAQKAEWLLWRNSSPEREQAWQRAEKLMSKLGGVPPSLSMAALDRSADPGRRAVITRLAALLALGPAAWASWSFTEQQGWMADYSAPVGEQRQLTLADGTQVLLNTDSSIDVQFDANQRLIRLRRGEILVQTASDHRVPSRPLRVATREGRLQALGTRFSVREHAGRTYLAVLEGAIKVEPAKGVELEPLVVKAGEKTDFDTYSCRSVSVVDDTVTAWTRSMLLADKMRLADFVSELARYRRGFLRCDPAIANLLVSGAFPMDDTARTLNMLVQTYPVALTTHMNGYWVLLSAR